MKRFIILLTVVIIAIITVGCQKSKADDISDYSFKQAKQFVAVTEKFLEGDIDLETTEKKLNDLERHFSYGDLEKGESDSKFTFIGSSMLIVISDLDDADNYDDEAIDEIKGELSDIEGYIYQ